MTPLGTAVYAALCDALDIAPGYGGKRALAAGCAPSRPALRSRQDPTDGAIPVRGTPDRRSAPAGPFRPRRGPCGRRGRSQASERTPRPEDSRGSDGPRHTAVARSRHRGGCRARS